MDTIKRILIDHDNRKPDELTVCKHGQSVGTLGSIIVLPNKKEYLVIDNYPYSSVYVKFKL